MRTVEQVKLDIAEIDRKLSEGVPADKAHYLQMDKVALQDELKELEQVQELPTEEVTAEIILATVDGLPLEVYTKSEDAAILIRCEVEVVIEGINKVHAVIVGGLNNKLHLAAELEAVLRQRNAELERDYEICAEENKESMEEIVKLVQAKQQIILERDEALKYRDNAAKQLEEMSFELEQNRIELNRNREARVYTEAERTTEQEAARQRFMDSRIKVYDVQWEDDIKRTHYVAKRAENGEAIRYSRLEAGGHLEITEDEALALQAMNKPVEMPPLVNEVDEESTFQEDASAESSLPSGEQRSEQTDCGSNEQAVREDAEPETFEEEVRRRLNTLELKVNKNDPEFFHEVA